MNETYTLHVAGLTRELKKVRVAPSLRIASFVMLGDTGLIEKCADALYEEIKKLGEIDMLVCPEAKGIPLTHALAVRMGVDYVVARKSVKGYMEHPIDEFDAAKLKGKKVCVVDDVVSTGGSLRSLEDVLAKTGCSVVSKVAVLLEEGGYSKNDLIYLERLPVFKD